MKSKHQKKKEQIALREKCPYLELFWSAFSDIRTEYGEIRIISPYSVQMRENTDQNKSEYGHFLRSVEQRKNKSWTDCPLTDYQRSIQTEYSEWALMVNN